jgi:hypothetical protein
MRMMSASEAKTGRFHQNSQMRPREGTVLRAIYDRLQENRGSFVSLNDLMPPNRVWYLEDIYGLDIRKHTVGKGVGSGHGARTVTYALVSESGSARPTWTTWRRGWNVSNPLENSVVPRRSFLKGALALLAAPLVPKAVNKTTFWYVDEPVTATFIPAEAVRNVSLAQIREILMPGVRQMVSAYEVPPAEWDRVFGNVTEISA